MNVEIKKYTSFCLIAMLVLAGKSHAQDLFDDSFLSNPENKSISVGTVKTKQKEQTQEVKTEVKDPAMLANELFQENKAPVPVSESTVKTLEPQITEKHADKMPVPVSVSDPVVEVKSEIEINPMDAAQTVNTDNKSVNVIKQTNADMKTPSEEIIGSISRTKFKEMADIETENSLLNLQLKQEKLKNEINSVKALQRKTMMDEIEKREMSARSKIEWEYAQEEREIELWEKRQKAELLAKQIESIVNEDNASKTEDGSSSSNKEKEETQESSLASEIYYIIEIRGVNGNLVAKIADDEEKKVFFVKKGSFLPTGHEIVQIEKDYIKLSVDGKEEIIGFSVTQMMN